MSEDGRRLLMVSSGSFDDYNLTLQKVTLEIASARGRGVHNCLITFQQSVQYIHLSNDSIRVWKMSVVAFPVRILSKQPDCYANSP